MIRTLIISAVCLCFVSVIHNANCEELFKEAGSISSLPPEILKKLSADDIQKLQQHITSKNKIPISERNGSSVGKTNGLNPKQIRPEGLKKNLQGQSVPSVVAFGQDSIGDEQEPKNQTNKRSEVQCSVIEFQYRHQYNSNLSLNLKQFGYDIFNSANSKITNLSIPDSSYLIGPGDKLLIRFWGNDMDAESYAEVDREGRINLPKIGLIPISGAQYGKVETIIKKEAEKYIQGINLSVTLTDLRTLEVYVVGGVQSPGLHMLPSFSTVFDGLLAAGGIKKTGTLRRIQHYRSKNKKGEFDLYDLLLKGKRDSDTMLQDRDVIFVPGIGPTAAVAGAVNNEGIFEIKNSTSVKELINIAGGLLAQATESSIDLRRFENNRDFLIKDLKGNSAKKWAKISIQNGDLIDVGFSIAQTYNTVQISGHVWNEEIYQYKPGIRLSDILMSPEMLKPEALTDFALIYRYDKTSTRTTPVRFPLLDVFNGKYDAALSPFDKIVVLSREDVGINEVFNISGAVWNIGEFKYHPGLKLKDAIALAGGLKFGARTEQVEITRQRIIQNRIQTEYIALNANTRGDFPIKANDSILIPNIKNASTIKKVVVTGEVAYPGTYTIRDGEKISDLIHRAGGFSDEAYFYGAKYTSEAARKIQQQSIDKMLEKLNLSIMQKSSETSQTAVSEKDVKSAEAAEKTLQSMINQLSAIKAEGRVAVQLADLQSFKNSIYDFRLEDGDTIDIPAKPSFVSVVGSVYSPGSFLYQPNQNLDFYLSKSGGLSKTADEDYMYLLKANGEILSMSQNDGFFSKFGNTVLMPGDTIVVPENLEIFGYLKLITDISDIAFKIATTAGVALSIAL